MKREQKAFVMLMAACMAFTGISSLMSASATPVSLKQAQIGNYLDDGARNETSPPRLSCPPAARSSKSRCLHSQNHKQGSKPGAAGATAGCCYKGWPPGHQGQKGSGPDRRGTAARQPVDGGKRITDEADCPERGRRPDGVSGAG